MKQCNAKTTSDRQCRNDAVDQSGFCRTHHPDAGKRPSTGEEFEESVLKILRLLGYTVQRNVTVAGCQIDIFAEYRTGAIRLRLMVECKDYGEGQTVGIDEVKEFSGVLYPTRGKAVDKGLLIARSGFTRPAKDLAESAGIDLIQFSDLANQLLDFDGYIDRVIREFDNSPVAKYYIDLSYALTEDYLGGDSDLLQRPLDDAVSNILFQDRKIAEQATLASSQGRISRIGVVDQELRALENQMGSSTVPKSSRTASRKSIPSITKSGQVLSKARIALLGNFGTGKSTWCRKYARDLATQYKEDRTRRIPIVVSLSDYETKLDIQQLVTNTLQFRYGVRVDLSICQELQRLGRFLFIFDGLDEMATRVDPEVVRENLREINKLARIQENVFIVTCRTHFFRDKVQTEVLADFETLFIPEWGESELREYLQKRFGEQWEKHLFRIHETHNLAELAQTPLFLEMITETLPKLGEQVRRSELYETYTETWIVEQSQRRGARLQSQERRQFVMELAVRLYKDNRLSCHYSEFFEMLQKRFKIQDAGQMDYMQSDVRNCTFLTRNAQGDYEFRHKSFMEYFVAKAISEQLNINSDELIKLKPLTVEVKGFVVEMLDANPPKELLVGWFQHGTDTLVRDNAFALLVGLQIQIAPEIKHTSLNDSVTKEDIMLFLQGNTEAFDRVVRLYLPSVISKLLPNVKNDESMARSFAYDAFLSMLNNRDRITSPNKFFDRLLSFARLRMIDRQRREQRQLFKFVSLEDIGYLSEYIEDPILPPDEQMIKRENSNAQVTLINAAMNKLTELERTIIQRSLFDAASSSDIAAECDLSVKMVSEMRYNAIRKLRKILVGGEMPVG